jgi:hypothetical protein
MCCNFAGLPFLWVFVLLSGIGLAVSLWVRLGDVMGRRVAPEAFFWMLARRNLHRVVRAETRRAT